MKNYIKIVYVFCALILVSACVDDDKLFELDDFATGALPNIVQTANDDGFIDLLDLSNSNVEFTVDFKIDFPQSSDGGITNGGSGKENPNTEYSDVNSVQLEVSYKNASTGVIESGVLSTISSWPTTVNIVGVADLIAAIPSLTAESDISLGDQFVFVCGISFADGREFPAFITDHVGNKVPNYSINFAGGGNNPGFNFAATYNVSCVSDLASTRIYDVSTLVTGTCCGLPTGTFTGTTATVTVGSGAGNYVISDFLAQYFTPFTGPADEPFNVNDVCNMITVDGINCPASSFLCYIPNTTDPTGSYDPVTDTWVLKWEDAFGNGIRGVTTLTPQ